MKYAVIKSGFKGIDIDFADYTELAATMVALKVLQEFGRMVDVELKKFGGEVIEPEDAELVAGKEAENIETAIRLYLNKRPDLAESSFEFNDKTTVEDGHANGGILRAVLRVIVKVAGEGPYRHEFEMTFDVVDRDLGITLVADPRNGDDSKNGVTISEKAAKVVKTNLESIIVRTDEGDPRSDWLPIISRLAKEALAFLPE